MPHSEPDVLGSLYASCRCSMIEWYVEQLLEYLG